MHEGWLSEDVVRFRNLIAERLGLQFEEDRVGQMGQALEKRMQATGLKNLREYLALLESPVIAKGELRQIAEQLTVGETYFFRSADHVRALLGHALPERLRVRTERRPIRILSAGCSTGEEAYTLAIAVREQLPWLGPSEVSILGIDLNTAALKKAEAARYTGWSLRETSEHVRKQYFRLENREFVLDDTIRAMVSFEERNLCEDDPFFWHESAFDIVFCRNVTIYFTENALRSVLSRIYTALAPGGFLFLGHAESLRGAFTEFEAVRSQDTFYYRKPDVEASRDASQIPHSSNVLHDDQPRPAKFPSSIPSQPMTEPSVEDTVQAALRLALALFREERFSEALRTLNALPAAAAAHSDVQLLLATILANQGKLDAAEMHCQRVLAIDGQSASAHYLAALCREHVGDCTAAVRHAQIAAYLDPSFAMPRMHLGRLARRAGDFEAAQRELMHALELLVREDPTRVLLFGGGFSRDALTRICRAELQASGATP